MDASKDAVAFAPTDGLCDDPSDPRYFDRALLQKELTRAFSLCASCRMCFKFCDSFANLFRWLDQRHDGDARRLTADEAERVLGSCFQCKLCEVQCPYTPRDKHPFQLDFPRLVHRAMAVRAREKGLTRQQRFLGDPDRSGRLARASLGLANRMNRFAPQRLVL